jgi:hypothetical protein
LAHDPKYFVARPRNQDGEIMENPTALNPSQLELCDQCHRSGVILIRSMAKWSAFDWFRCAGCGHLSTRPRRSDSDLDYAAARRDRRLTVSATP